VGRFAAVIIFFRLLLEAEAEVDSKVFQFSTRTKAQLQEEEVKVQEVIRQLVPVAHNTQVVLALQPTVVVEEGIMAEELVAIRIA